MSVVNGVEKLLSLKYPLFLIKIIKVVLLFYKERDDTILKLLSGDTEPQLLDLTSFFFSDFGTYFKYNKI